MFKSLSFKRFKNKNGDVLFYNVWNIERFCGLSVGINILGSAVDILLLRGFVVI